MRSHSAVGYSIVRRDALEKVTGKAKYCTDMKLHGMLYGRILSSPHAYAKIISIDTSKAEKLRGVRAVITGKDVPEKRFGNPMFAFDQHLLARDVVIFAGEAVAAVAADTIQIAEEALDLIEIRYEEIPGIFDVEAAWSTNPPVIIHPDLRNYKQAIPNVRLDPDRPNVCNHYKIRCGDVEKGFKEADVILENRFTTARIQQCAFEPHVCIAQIESDGSLTIWSTQQGLYRAKRHVCGIFGLPPSKVRIIQSHYIGGSFGSKFVLAVEPIAVMLAKKTGRPVRVALTREEVFTLGGNRIPTVIHIKDGVKKDGTIVAREMKVLVNVGAYASSGGALLARNISFGVAGSYRVPNLKLDSYGVYTNEPPVCPYRGFANEQPIWAIESHMDMIAEKMGLDAIEIRKKNLLKEGDINANGEIVHSIGAGQCFEQVAKFLDWGYKPREETGPWKKGKGLALGHKNSSFGVSIAIVKVQEDGTIEVRYSSDEFGQGCTSAMAQIVSEEFGIPTDRVKVVWGDTAITPYSTQPRAQGTTFNIGMSIVLACQDAKRQLFEIVAEKLNASPEELDAREGRVYVKSVPSRSIEIADLFVTGAYIDKVGEILGKGVFRLPYATKDDPETGQIDPELAQKGMKLNAFYSYAVYGVEVAVNVETGEVKITKSGMACDMGLPINPKMCEQQMDGAAGMGIGSALWEEMIMDQGKVLNPNWRDYRLPSAINMPDGENYKTFITPTPHKDGPYGAKGMGETVMTPVAPAIANAIYNAVGVRMKDLPVTREMVFQALRKKGTTDS